MFNVSAHYLSNGYLGLKPAKGTDYYERSNDFYAALYRSAPETILKDQREYRGIFSGASLEDCSKYCITATEYTCRSFAYNKDAKVCALSDVAATSAAAILKEPKYDYYQMHPEWPCNVSLPWNYKPRVIATPLYPYHTINKMICYLNLEAPPTRQVALTLTYFYTNKDTCTERTDGVTIYDGWSEINTKLAMLCHNSSSLPLHIKSSNGTLAIKIFANSSNVSMAAVYEFGMKEV
ncbi:hypothetical protein CHS0354_029492 [Potamilus streckersoni]|uniref:Uncharacterized protein n=1 Tax=Potamilus streckersoni TaxID=2493646 RepID=A0AAE0S757_9BIVA|nr:hypothetical protein CHS0354_029492 [Potamilus streckersoni]